MRRDPDEGHHGTLFAWPRWIDALVDRWWPTTATASIRLRHEAQDYSRYCRAGPDGVIPPPGQVQSVTVSSPPLGYRPQELDWGRNSRLVKSLYAAEVDVYAWHDVADMIGR